MNTALQRKIIQIKTRIIETQHVGRVCQAQHAGVTLSELIRQCVINKPAIPRAGIRAFFETGATGIGSCAKWIRV